VRYPLQIASKRILVKCNHEMFKETLHPQKPGKWKIFLESRFDNYCASGNIEHDIVQIRNVKAADAQCFFFGPHRYVQPQKAPNVGVEKTACRA
jgi:hypothetical protein